MQQYQIYQERKPRFKAMQFNGIEDVEALRAMSRAKGFDLTLDATEEYSLTLHTLQGFVLLKHGNYLVVDENNTSAVLDPKAFDSKYERETAAPQVWQAPPMAPQAAAPYPPMPTAPRTPR